MAKNKKPKKYTPRHVIRDPLGYFSKIPEGHKINILTRNHLSLEHMLKGEGDVTDWDEITAALNMGVVLDAQVYEGVYNNEFVLASNHHAECGLRLREDKRFVYTGPEMTAVREALEIHDVQMEKATTYEIDNAVKEAKRLFAAGHINPVQKAARTKAKDEN